MNTDMTMINELGELALSTRLMRLVEVTRKDVTRIYQEHGIAFESKWFPVFYVLSKKSPMSVSELAEELGYAHTSVMALVKEMQQLKWIKSVASKIDGRKRMLSLTHKAMAVEKQMQPLWENMRIVAKQIYNHKTSLLKAVENVEEAIEEESYYERYRSIEECTS